MELLSTDSTPSQPSGLVMPHPTSILKTISSRNKSALPTKVAYLVSSFLYLSFVKRSRFYTCRTSQCLGQSSRPLPTAAFKTSSRRNDSRRRPNVTTYHRNIFFGLAKHQNSSCKLLSVPLSNEGQVLEYVLGPDIRFRGKGAQHVCTVIICGGGQHLRAPHLYVFFTN